MKRVIVLLSLLMVVCVSAAMAYTPGTYAGSFPGHNGNVSVSVTVSEDAIESIEVTDSVETVGLGDWPISIVPQEIIDSQSLAVETVTGATFTSRAIIEGTKKALTEAGGDIEALTAEQPKAPVEDASYEADVVIVGGGGAGLAAACSASEAGASVILIEKMGTLGGNSLVSGGIYNAADAERQANMPAVPVDGLYALTEKEAKSELHQQLMDELRAQLDAYVASGSESLFDSAELHALQTYDGGDYVGNLELIYNMCCNSLGGLEWLEGMGLEIKPELKQGTGSLWQRTHYSYAPAGSAYIATFRETLAKYDSCTILLSTTGKSLITDESGKVIGVEAEGRYGNKVTATAKKGVIIATGGFAGNVELRQKYCEGEKWPDLGPSLVTSNMPGVTGDGIFMAEAVGAQLIDMDQIQLLQVCNPKTGSTSDHYNQSGVDGYVLINQEGNRFVDEGGRRDVISKAIIEQTNGVVYLVLSGDSITDPETQTVSGGRSIASYVESGESGWVCAETLDELAEKTGMDAANLKATIEAFNEHARSGEADEFGRTLYSYEFVTGPWYSYPRSPAAHHTMGGIKIDKECRVIDTEGNIMPGLFAAGEVTGGFHGGNRLGGNAIVDFVVNGRQAGISAAAE